MYHHFDTETCIRTVWRPRTGPVRVPVKIAISPHKICSKDRACKIEMFSQARYAGTSWTAVSCKYNCLAEDRKRDAHKKEEKRGRRELLIDAEVSLPRKVKRKWVGVVIAIMYHLVVRAPRE